MSASFHINNSERSIGADINNSIRQGLASEQSEILITTAYFTLYGWQKMFLNAMSIAGGASVKLLIGSNPDGFDYLSVAKRRKKLSKTPRESTINRLEEDRDRIPFYDNELIKKFTNWVNEYALENSIGAPKLEIKFYTPSEDEKGMLHAKTVLVKDKNTGHGRLFVGSANITKHGLAGQEEVTLSTQNPDTIYEYEIWFQKVWHKSSDFSNDILKVYRDRVETLDEKLVYLKIVESIIGDSRKNDSNYPEDLWMYRVNEGKQQAEAYEFQKEAARKILRKLDQYGGAILADDVGLGKTIVAISIIQRYLLENINVLIVGPASLRDTWGSSQYLRNKGLPLLKPGYNVDYISYNNLANYQEDHFKQGDPLNYPEKYGLIIFDEAHSLKNGESTKTYKALSKILAKIGNPKLLFLTATPINNSVMDLYNLIKLYLPDRGLLFSLGVVDVFEEFQRARDGKELLEIKQIANELVVRRTREFVKAFYHENKLHFPNMIAPVAYQYDSEAGSSYRRLVESFQKAIIAKRSTPLSFNLAVHDIYDYIKSKNHRKEYAPAPNIYLLRTSMLKALESSPSAFTSMCDNLLQTTSDRKEYLLKNRNIQEAKAFPQIKEFSVDSLLTYDTDESQDGSNNSDSDYSFLEVDVEEGFAILEVADSKEARKKISEIKIKDINYDLYIKDLEQDEKLLDEWIAIATEIEESDSSLDPKLSLFLSHFQDMIKRDLCSDRESCNTHSLEKKILVFTSYVKTGEYILSRLREQYPNLSIEMVSGETKNKNDFLSRFSPSTSALASKGNPIDVLITTDVLSEGVNLQECGKILNYDLPWNPMKVVQRVGRIDRIGSPHQNILVYNLLANPTLIEHLSLYQKLRDKMHIAKEIIGNKNVLGIELDASSISYDVENLLAEFFIKHPQLMSDKDNEVAYYKRQLTEEIVSVLKKQQGIVASYPELVAIAERIASDRLKEHNKNVTDLAFDSSANALSTLTASDSANDSGIAILENWYNQEIELIDGLDVNLKEFTAGSGTVVEGSSPGWILNFKIYDEASEKYASRTVFIEDLVGSPPELDFWKVLEKTKIIKFLNERVASFSPAVPEHAVEYEQLSKIWEEFKDNYAVRFNSEKIKNLNDDKGTKKSQLSFETKHTIKRILKDSNNLTQQGKEIILNMLNSDLIGYQIDAITSLVSIHQNNPAKLASELYGLSLKNNNHVFTQDLKEKTLSPEDLHLIAWVRVNQSQHIAADIIQDEAHSDFLYQEKNTDLSDAEDPSIKNDNTIRVISVQYEIDSTALDATSGYIPEETLANSAPRVKPSKNRDSFSRAKKLIQKYKLRLVLIYLEMSDLIGEEDELVSEFSGHLIGISKVRLGIKKDGKLINKSLDILHDDLNAATNKIIEKCISEKGKIILSQLRKVEKGYYFLWDVEDKHTKVRVPFLQLVEQIDENELKKNRKYIEKRYMRKY